MPNRYRMIVEPGGRRRLALATPREEYAAESVKLTIPQILASVGDNAERARVALAAERAGARRSTLIRKLEDIAND